MTAPKQTVNMLPTAVDLNVYAGDDLYLDVFVTDADGIPVDMTGATPSAQIRVNASDAEPLATFDATIEASVIKLHLPSEESTKLSAKCVWDCQIINPDVITLAAGKVNVTAEVTR